MKSPSSDDKRPTKRASAAVQVIEQRIRKQEASRLGELMTEGRASRVTENALSVKAISRITGKPALSKTLSDMRSDER